MYGDKVKSVAEEMGCSVVDTLSLLHGNYSVEKYGKNLDDGLHLNASGNKLLFEGFFPQLAPMEDGDGKYGDEGSQLKGSCGRSCADDFCS